MNTLKAQGYKLGEINDVINVAMSMTAEQLSEVVADKSRTILEQTVAAALLKSLKNGSLYSLDSVITRAHGYPTESVNANVQGDVKITLNLDGDNIRPPEANKLPEGNS